MISAILDSVATPKPDSTIEGFEWITQMGVFAFGVVVTTRIDAAWTGSVHSARIARTGKMVVNNLRTKCIKRPPFYKPCVNLNLIGNFLVYLPINQDPLGGFLHFSIFYILRGD